MPATQFTMTEAALALARSAQLPGGRYTFGVRLDTSIGMLSKEASGPAYPGVVALITGLEILATPQAPDGPCVIDIPEPPSVSASIEASAAFKQAISGEAIMNLQQKRGKDHIFEGL